MSRGQTCVVSVRTPPRVRVPGRQCRVRVGTPAACALNAGARRAVAAPQAGQRGHGGFRLGLLRPSHGKGFSGCEPLLCPVHPKGKPLKRKHRAEGCVACEPPGVCNSSVRGPKAASPSHSSSSLVDVEDPRSCHTDHEAGGGHPSTRGGGRPCGLWDSPQAPEGSDCDSGLPPSWCPVACLSAEPTEPCTVSPWSLGRSCVSRGHAAARGSRRALPSP